MGRGTRERWLAGVGRAIGSCGVGRGRVRAERGGVVGSGAGAEVSVGGHVRPGDGDPVSERGRMPSRRVLAVREPAPVLPGAAARAGDAAGGGGGASWRRFVMMRKR